MSPYRIAILSYHPMPYHVAFYRALHADARITETVLYLDSFGARTTYDPEFGSTLSWDNDILAGHTHKFLRNWSWNPHAAGVGRINPGVAPEILFGPYDALLTDYANPTTWMAFIAARLSGKPVIVRGEADLDRPYRTRFTAMKERFLPAVLRRAAAVMYSCEKNRRYFLHFGAREEQLFPILSTVDNAYFLGFAPQRGALREATRAAYGIPGDAIVAMFSGRMTPRKRAADLLAAFRRIAADHPRLWVLFVGDGAERAAMEADAAGCDRVVFAGFQNQSRLPEHYYAADIFVMPSEWDPTPKALNEALICGLPAIVTMGVGQAGDLVREGENGVVYPVGDVAALAAGLAMLAGDDARRTAYGAAATAAARAWSPEANVAGLIAALDYAFKTKGSRRG